MLAGYYSALRSGDLLSLRWDQIQNGLIVLPMSKTGDIIVCPLPESCVLTALVVADFAWRRFRRRKSDEASQESETPNRVG